MKDVLVLSAEDLRGRLPFAGLIEALREQYRVGCTVPERHHHTIEQGDEPSSTLLVMPAWDEEWLGLKSVTITPGNGGRGLPALMGTYLLSRKRTGEVVAVMDGAELTARRTAANSALAADYLCPRRPLRMVMVGTGTLAGLLPLAHGCVRELEVVEVWGRRFGEAERLAKELSAIGLDARAVRDLEEAVRGADLVSCATLSTSALVKGDWLKEGAHLDLVGAFRPHMREVDGLAMGQGFLVVDNRPGVLSEAGDYLFARSEGFVDAGDIRGDLAGVVRGEVEVPGGGRTVFKSVGLALQDLCAAKMAVR